MRVSGILRSLLGGVGAQRTMSGQNLTLNATMVTIETFSSHELAGCGGVFTFQN